MVRDIGFDLRSGPYANAVHRMLTRIGTVDREMACHKARHEVDLPLPVKGVEQSGAERLGIGGKSVSRSSPSPGMRAGGTLR
jgi:hypothetical protein